MKAIENIHNVIQRSIGRDEGVGVERKKWLARETEKSLRSQLLNVMNGVMKRSEKNWGTDTTS